MLPCCNAWQVRRTRRYACPPLTFAGLCAAPVHQMQEVYRYGTTDDCMGHWAAMYRCLKRKTKFADQVTLPLHHTVRSQNSTGHLTHG